ncbi:hypothetical protein C7B62_00300 [Pleurocapsa sp. CCALA 161]|uniref:hypothetical protein n=1 Tax=Pleurocapsa sp. CCALA 161 TaxID=2107688 RepID=UPI000D057EFE|nr:hypothetical protein [Pleurocapsa sp. CCALA 161]PSB12835.1 hypothetical protein C7B62_00300 [Pleurocapsa sp. CCALA 161]
MGKTKLQHISGATILLILSLTSIDISSASSLPVTVELMAIAIETDQLAQKESDDEMLDSLQETPYKAIALVRKEYTEDKYTVPAEFKQDIPGWNAYQKYAEYLPDL